ncbi:MAG: hypothetical protein ACJAUP_001718 [Cellvibrionaceae bacterium]
MVFIGGFKAPFVGQSRIRTVLSDIKHHILLNDTVMVIGEISHAQVSSEAIGEDGFIDIESLGTVNGLDTYHKTEIVKCMAYARRKAKRALVTD